MHDPHIIPLNPKCVGAYYFSLHLPGYGNVTDRYDEFDAKPKAAGPRGVHGDTRGHDDVFAARGAEIFLE